jgi:hypothetical protein
MLNLRYEEANINNNASRGKPRGSDSLCAENSGSLGWDKDSGSIADMGGSASGMDSAGIRSDTSEFESVDAQGKQGRLKEFREQGEEWASFSIDGQSSERIRGASGEESFRIWVKPCSVGWADFGNSFETPFRYKTGGSSGPKVYASIRLSSETGRLLLYAGSFKASQEIWPGSKKNFIILPQRKPLSLKMKQALPCIPDWVWVGPKRGKGCVSPLRVNTV